MTNLPRHHFDWRGFIEALIVVLFWLTILAIILTTVTTLLLIQFL